MTDINQESTISTLDKKGSEEHFDECSCKVEQALSLILGEIKKIDAIIHRIIHSKRKQEFLPTIDEKREFVKSINKDNSQVCRGIIYDLKNERHEINELLKLYNVCTQEFSKLKDSQKTQSEQIEEMRTSLEGIVEFLDGLEKERSKRSENVNEEREDLKIRDKNQEKLFEEISKWILELNESKLKEETKEKSRLAKLETERIQDRAMLIYAVKQIQQVNEIKSIIENNELSDSTTTGPVYSKKKIDIAEENLNQLLGNESEMEIKVTNFVKPKKSVRKKNLFPKISQKNGKEKEISNFESSSPQKNMEINSIPIQSYGCQNPIILGPYHSVMNHLSRKHIPFYLKLIGRKPERNRIKFMKIGDRYFSIE